MSKRIRGEAWLAVMVLVTFAVVTPLVLGADWWLVVSLAAAGLALPVLVLPLTWWMRALVVVAAIGTAAGLTDWSTERGMSHFLCVSASLVAGCIVGVWVTARRKWRRRMQSAQGADPSGLDPRNGAKVVGTLATWADHAFDYEAADPSPAIVLDAVRALDGDERSCVSVFRGKGRLDVGGDAAGLMVVQQSDDRRTWHQVIDPTQPVPDDPAKARVAHEVRVVFHGATMSFPRHRLVSLAETESAITCWLEKGEREPSLTWFASTRSDRAARPADLLEFDRPGVTESGRDVSHMTAP